MNIMMLAVAAAIALPAAALAQAAPAPSAAPPPARPGHDLKGAACKGMEAMIPGHSGPQRAGSGLAGDPSKTGHRAMDRSRMAGCALSANAGATPAPADPHAGHGK